MTWRNDLCVWIKAIHQKLKLTWVIYSTQYTISPDWKTLESWEFSLVWSTFLRCSVVLTYLDPYYWTTVWFAIHSRFLIWTLETWTVQDKQSSIVWFHRKKSRNITHLQSVIWVNESPYFTNLDLKEISTQTLHQPPISWTKVNFGRIPMYYTTERHPEIWVWGCFQAHSWTTLGVKGDEFWILWFKVIRLFWSRFGLKVSRDDSVKQTVILTNNTYTFL